MKLILDYSMIGAILEDIVMEDYIYTTMLKIIDYTGTHYSKSQFFVHKFNFDKNPTFSRVFHPKKKIDNFSREIKVEFLDKIWRFCAFLLYFLEDTTPIALIIVQLFDFHFFK